MRKVFFAAMILSFAVAKPILAGLLSVPGQYSTIQEAVDASSDGDYVRVGIGTYDKVAGFYDVDFRGKAITLFSSNGSSANCKIICPPGSRGFYFHSGEDVNSLLWGFTIEGGDVTNDPNAYGGGIWCDSNSSPEIKDVVIRVSSAKYGGAIACTGSSSPLIINSPSITGNDAIYGGGIYCENSSPTITDCNVNANTATGVALDPNAYGGGIYCVSSSPVINNCRINNNIVSGNTSNGGLSYGGGIYCKNSSPNVTKCQINGNSIGDYTYPGFGGGIHCRNSSPVITDCNIIGNTANGHWGGVGTESYGGGIDCSYFSFPTIKNSTIADNTSTHGGGINCFKSSSPVITACTVSGNLALTGEGGGMLLEQDSNSIISNCTIKGNWADSYGGGIDCLYSSSPAIYSCVIVGNTGWYSGGGLNAYDLSSPTITNSTIADNAAAEVDSTGGGVYIDSSSPVFTNSILWGNADKDSAGTTESAQIYVFSGTTDVNYSCIQGLSSFAGNNNISGNPMFVLDPNDGGDGWADDPHTTGPDEGANDNFGDLHIQGNSPCRQAGNPNFVAGPNDIDIDGQMRIVAGRVDIGADEFYNSYEGDFDFDMAVNGDDLEIFAAHWQDTACSGSAGNYTDWCYGTDLNRSGEVEFTDYARFAVNWLTAFGG